MNRITATVLVAAVVVLAVFDVLMLRQVRRLHEEKATLQARILPSLEEQYDLFEHEIEGEELDGLFASLAETVPRFAELIAEPAAGTLLVYVPNENCRRALHSEVRVFDDYRETLAEHRVRPIFVFAGFPADDLDALTRQFGIDGASVTDREEQLRDRFGLRGEPVVLLLDADHRIRYANVVRGEEASRRLYDKAALLTNGHPG